MPKGRLATVAVWPPCTCTVPLVPAPLSYLIVYLVVAGGALWPVTVLWILNVPKQSPDKVTLYDGGLLCM